MEEGNEILNSLNQVQVNSFEFNIIPFLKVPVILLLVANLLFSLILYLRIRILADTFVTGQNKIIKSIVVLYLILTFTATLLAILFLILA